MREDNEANTVLVQALAGLAKPLAYRVPAVMAPLVHVGSLIRVPLRSRSEFAVVRALNADDGIPLARLKYLHSVEYEFPVLTGDLIRLADWMARYYCASIDGVLEMMVPRALRKGMGKKTRKLLRLVKRLDTAEEEQLKRQARQQARLYAFLKDQTKPVPRNKVLEGLKIGPGSCKGLVDRGVAEEIDEEMERVAYADSMGDAEVLHAKAFDLNEEQRAAGEDLAASLDTGEFRTHLLHGVTGSGKTEVYIHAVNHALEKGGGVAFLVPEVALTPQTMGRLRARLERAVGTRVAVWHSGLSAGERLDAWEALATGKARVVVGARSAVFAPIHDLRLVIVDEEHEPAYKQDETPRYHGRDVAVYRAMLNKAVCVLGSATPSLESLYNAHNGKYRLNELKKRVDDRKLPVFHVVDLGREVIDHKAEVTLSRLLVNLMRDRLEKREQTILFLNRRGYSPTMLCPQCEWVAQCPHCSITLTWHKHDEILRCHLCDYTEDAPRRCPKCGSPKVRRKGSGTQRIEDVVSKLLPTARVVRIDADTMRKKNLYRQILGDFRKGDIDILVGTQMIAKGLDFPNVTLVGMVSADISMHIPDFRAAERTFQLLVQVAGRAGRGDRAGEVVVQSFMPMAPPIQYARQEDFIGFLEEELEQRRQFSYPPFRHLLHHLFRGRNQEKVEFYAEQWARFLEERLPHPEEVEIRGPAPAPVEKIKDNYRYQLWYFVRSASRFSPTLQEIRSQFKMDKDVIDVVDVDPVMLT